LRAWLVGQAVALREMSWGLSNIDMPPNEAITRWKGLAWLLAKATAAVSYLPAIPPPSQGRPHFTETQQQADGLARRASDAPLNDDSARGLLQTLAAADSDFATAKNASREEMFRRAERLVLALDRLTDAVAHEPTREVKNPKLVQLFGDVRSADDFQPAQFSEHLKNFRATTGQPPH